MRRVEISINDAARSIYRVVSYTLSEEDTKALLDLQVQVNEILKKYGLETRFANDVGEAKKEVKQPVK